ncbi:MAG: hypothetical protein M3O50_02915 [Myxococcota bacterium]|nr:hypothetical protein [Myxococcota bacterium]
MNPLDRIAAAKMWTASAAALLFASACSRSALTTAGPPEAAAADEVRPDHSKSVAAAALDGKAPVLATVTLLEPGKLPRGKLRYAWQVQQREQLAMDLRTSASSSAPGAAGQTAVPLPPIHIVIAIEPRSVSTDGDLRYEWQVTSATVVAASSAQSPVLSGMRAEVSAVEHLAGTGLVTSRGIAKEVVIDRATATDAGATGQMVEQVRQTLRDVAAPLPEEEVGVGARWEKQSELEDRETRITQTETFALRELEGNHGALFDSLAQSAPPQTLRASGTAPAQARMESMLASGNASVRFDLSRLVPQTTFDGTTTMVVSGRSTVDVARRLTMILHVNIVIEGTKR